MPLPTHPVCYISEQLLECSCLQQGGSGVVDTDAGRHDYLMVGVNVSDHDYVPLLVYHTGAVVVQVSVKSLAQCHDVPHAQTP